jgi:hypothetical protein
MFSQNGLSLDQAPPVSVIFRFFFSGALFGILSGSLILVYKTDIFDAYTMAAVTFTHTLTLGVMLSFMFAALFQMLPVIAGITLTSPVKKANWVQYPFVVGVIALLAYSQPLSLWLYLSSWHSTLRLHLQGLLTVHTTLRSKKPITLLVSLGG